MMNVSDHFPAPFLGPGIVLRAPESLSVGLGSAQFAIWTIHPDMDKTVRLPFSDSKGLDDIAVLRHAGVERENA
jgi:hypothetical protein